MKLLWILFLILFELAWKIAMIIVAFYLVVAIGMGIIWIFTSKIGLTLLGIAILVIIMMIARSATGNTE